ncbi:MAG: TetR family transcriptional regulator [Alphaproteobacteria bacterium]|nr:TetR family transcriptional regulator [Alphaproteobacteria bacterium]
MAEQQGTAGNAPDDDASPSPRRRRKRLSAEERRAQILKAAQRVFIRSGLGGSRTRELAREAGVNEATLFAHFKTKEELFDAAVVEPLERLAEKEIEIARSYNGASTVEEQRRLNVEAHRRLLDTIVDVYPLLMTGLFSDSERGRRFYASHLYPWFQAMATTIRESLGGRRRKDLDPEVLSMVGVGAYLAIVMDHTFLGKDLDHEKMIRIVSTLFDSGAYLD